MFYSINFLNSEGAIVSSVTDYFVNQESLLFFAEFMLILHEDIVDYVII